MNHKQAYELIESYVFGTLEEAERSAVEDHVDTGCQECVARVREVGELSARLATAVDSHDPPERLRAAILQRARDLRGGPAAAAATPASAPDVTRAHSPRIFPGWLPASAGVAALLMLMFWTFSLRQDLGVMQAQLEDARARMTVLQQDMAAYDDAVVLLGMPCTRLVDLQGVDPNPQAFGKILIHPEQTYAVVYVYRMPEPPAGKKYQLWYKKDGVATSAGLFDVAGDGSAAVKMEALTEPATIGEFAVTIEPASGMPEPTGMLYLTGQNVLDPNEVMGH